MYPDLELPNLKIDAEQALPLITSLLAELGYQVLPSFNLQAARASQAGCTCPHHGTVECDCQMIVLLIYGQADQPASLVVHGQDGKTFLSLVDTPQQRPDRQMFSQILKALAANSYGAP